MSYIKPELVVSPKARVSELEVIYDGEDYSWALAKMKWDGNSALGMRWNSPGVGNPQSRGIPTWFILPEEVGKIVIEMLELNRKIKAKE